NDIGSPTTRVDNICSARMMAADSRQEGRHQGVSNASILAHASTPSTLNWGHPACFTFRVRRSRRNTSGLACGATNTTSGPVVVTICAPPRPNRSRTLNVNRLAEVDFSLANAGQSRETGKGTKSLPLGMENIGPQPWLSPTIPPCQDLTTWGGYVTM